MLEISVKENNQIELSGRFDAAQEAKARAVLDRIEGNCTIDFENLIYISSSGLSVMIYTYKRLKQKGYSLTLVNLNSHILDIFKLTGLDKIFDIY